MTNAQRRGTAAAMIAAAIFCLIAAGYLWQHESAQADDAQLVEEYRAAIDGDFPEDIEPDRVPAIALGAVAAVVFLGGILLFALTPAPDPADDAGDDPVPT